MRYLAATLILLATALVASGCLSPEQRQAVIDDAALTQDLVTTLVPAGPKRDALLKDLAAATTVEQQVQVRVKARAATQPSPTTSQH